MKTALTRCVQTLLDKLGAPITFVDIGSRNGVVELSDIAGYVRAYGFEPNPEEYEKLVSGKTDAAQLLGIHSPEYQNLTLSPYAVFDTNGTRDFFITKSPGASGLRKPNFERLKEIKYKRWELLEDFGADYHEVQEIAQVEVRTLDWFVQEQNLSHIDYLKIDVEGVEWEVFDGGSSILDKVGVIKAETCFIPFREDQKLFSDVDMLLRKYGFDLLHYEIEPGQVGYKERKFSAGWEPDLGMPDPYGQPLSCDAIYVNRAISDPERLYAQSIVLIQKGYLDEALFILKNKVSFQDASVIDILQSYKEELSLKSCLRLMMTLVDNATSLAKVLFFPLYVPWKWRKKYWMGVVHPIL